MDSRRFLKAAGVAGTALALPNWAAAAEPLVRSRSSGTLYLDAQGVIDGFDKSESGRFVLGRRLRDAIAARQMDLLSITVGSVGNGPDRFRLAMEYLARLDHMVEDYPALLAKIQTQDDIVAARQAGRLVSRVVSFLPRSRRDSRSWQGARLRHTP